MIIVPGGHVHGGANEQERATLPHVVFLLYVDERFTSVEAERRLIDAGASRARRKSVIDQQAAVLILQTWLDEGEAAVYLARKQRRVLVLRRQQSAVRRRAVDLNVPHRAHPWDDR